jgi:DNA-binding NarL/FixJ family response regulator
LATVVLVDDHKLLRDGIRAIIEASPEFDVVAEGSDGREGVQLAAKHRPDIVLLDIWMPNLSGIEACSQIRRESPRSRVVMMSQHDTGSYVQSALREGACGYVLKTAASTDLIAALRAAMDNKCYLSPDVAQTVVESFTQPAGEPASPLHGLTGREREILQLIAEGFSSKEVAQRLSISVRTVESHRSAVMGKLDVHKVAGLVRFAIREGLIAP